MKYSIIMPYYNRLELRFTLKSYAKYYSGRDDVEIIIVEDSKNNSNKDFHNKLNSLIKPYNDILKINLITDPKVSYNPSSKYNLGFRVSTGKILMLTSPEIPHTMDVLSIIDKDKINNIYFICACKSMFLLEDKGSIEESVFKFHKWYQHTQHQDTKYHFCTVISKLDYEKVGGFNEVFCAGIAYDDNNFVKRVQKAKLVMVSRDDLVTYHIEHSRGYGIAAKEYGRLIAINKNIWASQLVTEEF